MYSALLTFLIVAITCRARAEVAFNNEGRFYINLPAPWVQVPNSILGQWVREAEQFMPKMRLNEFSFAYQPKSPNTDWLTYPYCIGYVFRGGRLDESGFIRFAIKDFSILYPKAEALARQRANGLVDKAQLGQPYYDSQRHILWTPLQVTLSDTTPVEKQVMGIVAQLLTAEGYIKLRFYAAGSDYVRLLPTFRAMVESVTLPSDLQY